MAVALKAKPLPTREQMRATVKAVIEADEALSQLVYRLPSGDVSGPTRDEWEAVTFAQLGELFNALVDVEMSAGQIKDAVDRLRDRLVVAAVLRDEQALGRGEAGS